MAMALGYDWSDTVPTSMPNVQLMSHSTTAPVWSGYQGASCLHDFTPPCEGAVILDVDVTRFGSGNGLTYYRYTNPVNFTALSAQDKNVMSPGYLLIATANGSVITPGVPAGQVFVNYVVELLEPISGANNN